MLQRIAPKFEELIKDIFIYLGFQAELTSNLPRQSVGRQLDLGIDIEISKGTEKFGIEVKLQRTRRVPIDIVKNALIRLGYSIKKNEYSGGLLVITANIDPSIREDLKKEFGFEIIDRGLLLHLTKDNEGLRQRLESILLDITQSGDQDIYSGVFHVDPSYEIQLLEPASLAIPETKVSKGANLCSELENLTKGRGGAGKYEEQCEKILRYIFEHDFSNWSKQTTTKDTLHRFDLIAKIASTNDFWKTLSRDFHSRFVVFEFKNYTQKIKQGQVYSTEKYLYSTALRTIAFILSRDGADKNAITAMEGALREVGKLIISLTQKDLCEMLNMKDKGDDPNSYLSERVDDILMKLSR